MATGQQRITVVIATIRRHRLIGLGSRQTCAREFRDKQEAGLFDVASSHTRKTLPSRINGRKAGVEQGENRETVCLATTRRDARDGSDRHGRVLVSLSRALSLHTAVQRIIGGGYICSINPASDSGHTCAHAYKAVESRTTQWPPPWRTCSGAETGIMRLQTSTTPHTSTGSLSSSLESRGSWLCSMVIV